MCKNGTCRDEATCVSENGGSVLVGTAKPERTSPEEGVDGQGEDALPVWHIVQHIISTISLVADLLLRRGILLLPQR